MLCCVFFLQRQQTMHPIIHAHCTHTHTKTNKRHKFTPFFRNGIFGGFIRFRFVFKIALLLLSKWIHIIIAIMGFAVGFGLGYSEQWQLWSWNLKTHDVRTLLMGNVAQWWLPILMKFYLFSFFYIIHVRNCIENYCKLLPKNECDSAKMPAIE